MSDNCTDAVPVLIRRATFCSAFAADARDFRSYNSWVRAHAPFRRHPNAPAAVLVSCSFSTVRHEHAVQHAALVYACNPLACPCAGPAAALGG